MSNGSAVVSTWNRWLGTTWKMSPALMYSWQWRTTASYCARVKFERGWRSSGPSVSMSRSEQLGAGLGQPCDQFVDPGAGGVVGRGHVDPGPDVRVRHDQHGLADVVEDDHPVVKGERQVGQAAVVGRGIGQVSVYRTASYAA